jgi:hypothetical protein
MDRTSKTHKRNNPLRGGNVNYAGKHTNANITLSST